MHGSALLTAVWQAPQTWAYVSGDIVKHSEALLNQDLKTVQNCQYRLYVFIYFIHISETKMNLMEVILKESRISDFQIEAFVWLYKKIIFQDIINYDLFFKRS